MAGQYDILSQLLEASFRDIPFPTLMVHAEGGHNVVTHKRVDRNGWRVENTGMNGYVFSFKIPCINSLVRGPNETWESALYPDVYLKILSALEDRSTGPFVHPSYGKRSCKVDKWSEDLDPDFRGGPTLTVSLLETVDSGDAVSVADTSVIPIAKSAAADLDNVIGSMDPYPYTGTDGLSLEDFVDFLGSLADQWELFKAQMEARVNRVIAAMDKLSQKFGYVPGFSQNTQALISALHAMKNQATTKKSKPVSVLAVRKATSKGALAQRTKNSVQQIIELNPELAKSAVVPANVAVRYYA